MSSLSSEGEQGGVRRTGHRRVDRVDAAFVQRHLVTWRIMHEICRAAHGTHTSLHFTCSSLPALHTLPPHLL